MSIEQIIEKGGILPIVSQVGGLDAQMDTNIPLLTSRELETSGCKEVRDCSSLVSSGANLEKDPRDVGKSKGTLPTLGYKKN